MILKIKKDFLKNHNYFKNKSKNPTTIKSLINDFPNKLLIDHNEKGL
jgi:hypothetical protein